MAREETLKQVPVNGDSCELSHTWDFELDGQEEAELQGELRQAIQHMVLYRHQVGGSEYGGYKPDESLAERLNLAYFQKTGLLKPPVLQFRGDISRLIEFTWPEGFKEEPTPEVKVGRFRESPESIEFWREIKKDLEEIQPELMTPRSFLANYHPEKNKEGKYAGSYGKYFTLYVTHMMEPQGAEGYITGGFVPPADNPEFVTLVEETRHLIESKLKKPYGWARESHKQLSDPEFWTVFEEEVGTFGEKTSFQQFLLSFHSPDSPFQPWRNDGKYRSLYNSIRGQLSETQTSDEEGSKTPKQHFYDLAPLKVKIQLMSKFTRDFGAFALETLRENDLLPPEAQSILANLGSLSIDTQDHIIQALTVYVISTNPSLQGNSNSEVKIVLEQAGRRLHAENRNKELVRIETLVQKSEFLNTLLREASSEESTPQVIATKELVDTLRQAYFLPLIRNLLYKPTALYWSLSQSEDPNHSLVSPDNLTAFLRTYAEEKLTGGNQSEDQKEVLEFIKARVLPEVYKSFAEIAAFASKIAYFREKGVMDRPQHLFFHQVEAIKILMEKRGGIVSDEPGTGKTLILALAALNLLNQDKPAESGGRILVVGTKSVIDNWEGELNQHLDMDGILSINVNFTQDRDHQLSQRELRIRLGKLDSALGYGDYMKQFVLVNYDLFRNANFRKILGKYSFDGVIIDEAHNVKSRFFESIDEERLMVLREKDQQGSRVAQRTRGLYDYIKSHPELAVFLATSTPFVKDLIEPLIMAHLTDPNLIPSARVKELMSEVVGTHQALREVMIRRKKEEIADLPLKDTIFAPIDLNSLSDEEKEEFKSVAQELIKQTKGSFARFYSLLALEGIAKYPWLAEKVQQIIADGRKVVIFTPFVEDEQRYTAAISTTRIVSKLRQAGINSVGILDGSLSEEERLRVQQDFKRKDGIKVLVGNYLTAGESITLNSPENRATEVILFIGPSSISRYIQAVDRIHRFGQTEKVTIHIPYVTGDLLNRDRGTYDERIVMRLNDELVMFGAVVDGLFFVESADIYQSIVRAEAAKFKQGVTFKSEQVSTRAPSTTRKIRSGTPGLMRLPGEILDEGEDEERLKRVIYEDSYVDSLGPATLKEIALPGRQSEDLVNIYLNQIRQYLRITPVQEQILYQYIEQGKSLDGLRRDNSFLETTPSEEDREKFINTLRDSASIKDFVVNSNLPLVVSRAQKQIGRGLEFWDLIQEGNAGLMTAADKFDYKRGFHFSTYAVHWIDQHMTRATADKSRTVRIPVHLHEALNQARRHINEFLTENGRPPKASELRPILQEKTRIPRGSINLVLATLQGPTLGVRSLDQTIGSDDEDELYAVVPDTFDLEERVEESTEEDDLKRDVYNAMKKHLSERETQVLRLRFGMDDGKWRTLEEVSLVLGTGLTRERIRQIQEKGLSKLRKDQDLKKRHWENQPPSFLYHMSAEASAFRLGLFNDKQSFVDKLAEQLSPELQEVLYQQVRDHAIPTIKDTNNSGARIDFDRARVKIWEGLGTLSREDLFDPQQAGEIYGKYSRAYLDPAAIRAQYQKETVPMRRTDRQVFSQFFGVGVARMGPLLSVEGVARKLKLNQETVVHRLHNALQALEVGPQVRRSLRLEDYSSARRVMDEVMQRQDIWQQIPDQERSMLTLYFKNQANQPLFKENLARIFSVPIPQMEKMIADSLQRAGRLLGASLVEKSGRKPVSRPKPVKRFQDPHVRSNQDNARLFLIKYVRDHPNEPIDLTKVAEMSGAPTQAITQVYEQLQAFRRMPALHSEFNKGMSVKDVQRQLSSERAQAKNQELLSQIEDLVRKNPKITNRQLIATLGVTNDDVWAARQTLRQEGRIPFLTGRVPNKRRNKNKVAKTT